MRGRRPVPSSSRPQRSDAYPAILIPCASNPSIRGLTTNGRPILPSTTASSSGSPRPVERVRPPRGRRRSRGDRMAEAEARSRRCRYVLYAKVRSDEGAGLVWLAGIDPSAQSRPNSRDHSRSGDIPAHWPSRPLWATSALCPGLDRQDDRQGQEDANDDANRAAKNGTGSKADQTSDEVSLVAGHPRHHRVFRAHS
jgi:hypothetical protein